MELPYDSFADKQINEGHSKVYLSHTKCFLAGVIWLFKISFHGEENGKLTQPLRTGTVLTAELSIGY